MLFLSVLTSVILPFFFKIWASFIFGSYTMVLTKGFDE